MRERGLSQSQQLMLDNACLIMQGDNLNAWHLICDTTRESIEWLKRIHHKQKLTVIKYPVGNTSPGCFSVIGNLYRTTAGMENELSSWTFIGRLGCFSVTTNYH